MKVFVSSTVHIKMMSTDGIKLMSHIEMIYLTIQLDVNVMLSNMIYEVK